MSTKKRKLKFFPEIKDNESAACESQREGGRAAAKRPFTTVSATSKKKEREPNKDPVSAIVRGSKKTKKRNIGKSSDGPEGEPWDDVMWVM